MKTTKYILMSVGFLAICVGFLAGRYTHKNPAHDINVASRTDTLTVYDTIIFEKPVPTYIYAVDTLFIPATDTVIVHDTTYVLIQKERKIYEDSTYRAVVSGYMPSLDSIAVYPATKYINTARNITAASTKRWGIGIQVGYGLHVYDGQIYHAPYLGIGISYNIIRF